MFNEQFFFLFIFLLARVNWTSYFCAHQLLNSCASQGTSCASGATGCIHSEEKGKVVLTVSRPRPPAGQPRVLPRSHSLWGPKWECGLCTPVAGRAGKCFPDGKSRVWKGGNYYTPQMPGIQRSTLLTCAVCGIRRRDGGLFSQEHPTLDPPFPSLTHQMWVTFCVLHLLDFQHHESRSS